MKGEAVWLAGLARAAIDPSRERTAWLAAPGAGGLDTELLLAMARRHRLGGLAYRGLRRAGSLDGVAPRLAEAWQTAYHTSLARNLVLFHRVAPLVEAARRAGIRLALLKGAAFAVPLYGDPGLRPMSDVDLLVGRADAAALAAIAERNGFRRRETTDHAVLLLCAEGSFHVELHTSLTSCPDFLDVDADELLRRARRVDAGGLEAWTLAPEDHLLHLALHAGFQHGGRQAAINACDAFLLAETAELDWGRFVDRAARPRLAPFVFAGLCLTERLFPSAHLAEALGALAPHLPARERRWAARLRIERLLDPAPTAVHGAPWLRIARTRGLRSRLALVRETLSPTPADAVGPAPRGRGRPFRRGLRLAWRHAVAPAATGLAEAVARPGPSGTRFPWRRT